MELVSINERGTQKYKLKDGRYILSYESGYVRIDNGSDRLYQINKTRVVPPNKDCKWESVERILIHCPKERFEYIKAWVDRNVGDLPYDVVRQLQALKFYKKEYWNERI